jgi:3-hydroxybutyryl-CoA dehydratase
MDFKTEFFNKYTEGYKVNKSYTIDKESYSKFLDLFKDTSSIHTDIEYAKERGFKDIIIHGSMLTGYLSNFTGTFFPGDRSFTQSVEVQFKAPIYVNDTIKIECELTQMVESVGVLILDFLIYNETQNYLSAEARIQTGIL